MLAGVLVDVSSSMESVPPVDVQLGDQSITCIRSMFSTVVRILQRAGIFRENEEVFVLAFGLQDINTCDLLSLMDDVRRLDRLYNTTGHERLTQLMARNGAPYTTQYIKKYLSQQAAGALFETFSQNRILLMNFITKLHLCKDATVNANYSTSESAFSISQAAYFVVQNLVSSFFTTTTPAAPESEANGNDEEQTAKKYIEEVEQLSAIIKLKTMSTPRKWPLHNVASLLRDVVESSNSPSSPQEPLLTAHLSRLVNPIKPYIHGDSSMCAGLRHALETFQSTNHTSRVLFILSNGESEDGDRVELAEQLRSSGVIIFVCLVSSENISHPRRLYYEPDPNWTKAQRQMFDLSSTVENCHSAMSILLEQGWELPEAGHSRLFIQANHPDVIKEFSNLLIYISEHNDVLLSMVGRVSLDMYINASNSTFEPRLQIGGTSFAYTVATVFHSAMRRIEGREGGVPDFADICQKLIDEYGKDGAVTETVLKIWAPKYRLHYKGVDERGARQAINRRRPVVATFRLANQQWNAFSRFYRDDPQGVLESKDLGPASVGAKSCGHAVVLMKCDPTSLTFINSWGTDFADKGFFRVRNQATLNLKFYDVYWTLNDLKPCETQTFKNKSIEKGQNLIQKLLPGIQRLPYRCPQCSQSSPANQFTGHFLEATCPICHQSFKPTALGLMRSFFSR